ncbi:MAG: TlpA family protein disulfide reductase [Betaproteobacteria bacterium]|nr:TlpA family protein disulfide reductase [Betaproteobacteria bacterium]
MPVLNLDHSKRLLMEDGGRRRRWWRTVTLVLVGALALGLGAYFGQRQLGLGGAPGAGRDASALLAIALPDADGREQALGQWKGKVLVVNFWATWCAPCREEMPEFIRAQGELGDRGLQFVGIAVDQADKVRQFAGEIGLNYPALIGGYGAMELSKSLGNQLMALPFTVIIGRDGTVAHTQLGPLRDAQLRSIVGQLL